MPHINFPVMFVRDREVICVHDTPESIPGKRTRSFIRVYGRQRMESENLIVGGNVRLCVHHPDSTREIQKSTTIEVFPNRAYMIDCEKNDFGNVIIVAQDIGSNGVSSFGIEYPWDVYDAIGFDRIKQMQGY